jgi:predicted alpha/beta-hydrolase family hydrolase
MKSCSVWIPVGKGERVSGIVKIPDGFESSKTVGVILAHGAANDMNNPLIVAAARGLCREGFLALRFNFLYKENERKSPDSQKILVGTWHAVYQYLKEHPEFAVEKVVAAGKSMGGRVASQMAAAGELPVQGLVFLGYPLHAPGKKDKLRDSHLYDINVPLLFFAGARDSLCDLGLLKKVLARLKVARELEVIDGGDHSFKMLKSADIAPEQVHDQIILKMVAWLKANL